MLERAKEAKESKMSTTTTIDAVCIPPPLEHTDPEFACRSSSSTSLMTMVGNESTNQQCTDSNTDEATKFSMEMPCPVTVSIPKVEPCSQEYLDSSNNSLNTDQLLESPISFAKPYKIKDPIVLLEKCDKIWETLKLIKNVQGSKSTNTLNSVSLKNTDDKPYVKYQPVVLGDNNATLPHLKLSVKSSRRLHQCTTCGNLYLQKKSLRYHTQVVHGIYLSVENSRNSIPLKTNVNKDKESNIAETECSDLKMLPLKKSHSKQSKDSLSPCAKSHVNKSNLESTSNTQFEGKKTNFTRLTKDTLNSGESVRKDKKKSMSPEELNEDSTSSSTYYQCILCKQHVKDLRKHLIDYHKIVHTDLMLKELKRTSIVEKVNKPTNSNNNNSLRNGAVTSDKQKLQNNRKRKLNRSHTGDEKRLKMNVATYKDKDSLPDNKYKCPICSSLCRPSHVSRHMKGHRNRGETKENFHIINSNMRVCLDGNSISIGRYKCLICSETFKPHNIRRHVQGHHGRGETKENFRMINNNHLNPLISMKSKGNENSRNTSLRNINGFKDRNQNNSVNLFTNKRTNQRKSEKRKKFYSKNDDKHNTTCACGRSFRDSYTMHVHKRVCKLESDTTGERARRSRNRMVSNSTPRINITIKKRNDSYEIVDRKADGEKKLQCPANDSKLSTDSCDNDIETQQKCNETSEVSKYSENHSFLIIQDIDEDIDVDIEENSQNVSATSDTMENVVTTDLNQPLSEFFITQEENKINTNTRRSSNRTRKSALKLQKRNICICGTLFDSRKALDFHILKHQSCARFTCGYCGTTFPDAALWRKHQCNTSKIKLFIDIPQELDCKLCNISVNSYTAFDEHIRQKHFDPVVPIQCYQCDKRFWNVNARRTHIRSEHEQYACSMCDMIYTYNMKNRHEGYHYGLGHPCHICKKTYSSKKNYVKHIQKSHCMRRSQDVKV